MGRLDVVAELGEQRRRRRARPPAHVGVDVAARVVVEEPDPQPARVGAPTSSAYGRVGAGAITVSPTPGPWVASSSRGGVAHASG